MKSHVVHTFCDLCKAQCDSPLVTLVHGRVHICSHCLKIANEPLGRLLDALQLAEKEYANDHPYGNQFISR